MSYRDDRDADQARIAALEAELASARGRIAQLEHRDDQALVLAEQRALESSGGRSRAERWLGAPLDIVLVRTFEHAYPAERFEELLASIRKVADKPGIAEVLRSSFTWRAAFPGTPAESTTVTVAVRDGKTELEVRDRLRQLAAALYGGFGGGLGVGGGFMTLGAAMAVPWLAPLLLAGWLGALYGTARTIFVRQAKRRARLAQQLFDRMCADIDAAR